MPRVINPEIAAKDSANERLNPFEAALAVAHSPRHGAPDEQQRT